MCLVSGLMSKTHAEKIREAVTDLVIASPNEIMGWISKHYPENSVNPRSYRADIIGCSINHSSSHHYPSSPKFLWFEENSKKYRLATPEESSKKELIEEKNQPFLDTEEYIDGIAVSKLSITGQVKIPSTICQKLGFKHGDMLAFLINENGVLEVKKAKIKIEIE